MKEYISAQIEVIKFDSEDVITTSLNTNMQSGGNGMPTNGTNGDTVGY